MKLFRVFFLFLISMSIGILTACGAEATESTSLGESVPSESVCVTESSPVSATPIPIDTATIVPLESPVIYEANTDGARLYTDVTRTAILRSLAQGEQITVTGQSNRYALTSDGGYVNLFLLTAIGPVVIEPLPTETTAIEPTETIAVATPTPTPKPKTATPTPKPTQAAATTTTAATTAAPTETWYVPNCENIRNLVIAKLHAMNLWYPDAENIGGGWAATTFDWCQDEKYADSYVQGKFSSPYNNCGVTSVTVTIWVNPDDGLEYLRIDTTKCALPTATPAA